MILITMADQSDFILVTVYCVFNVYGVPRLLQVAVSAHITKIN